MKRGLILILIFILLAVSAYFLFNGQSGVDEYYVVTGNSRAFALGDPVYVDGEIAGFVTRIANVTDTTDHALIAFELRKDINIPDNSQLEAMMIDSVKRDVALNFMLRSSEGYLQPGDTLFLTLNKIARARSGKPAATSVKPDTEKISGSSLPVDKSDPVNPKSTPLKYGVQIYMSKEKKDPDDPVFLGLKNVKTYKHKGIYKYYVGEAQSLKEAAEIKTNMVDNGFSDAFVVAFHKGDRISIDQALSLEK